MLPTWDHILPMRQPELILASLAHLPSWVHHPLLVASMAHLSSRVHHPSHLLCRGELWAHLIGLLPCRLNGLLHSLKPQWPPPVQAQVSYLAGSGGSAGGASTPNYNRHNGNNGQHRGMPWAHWWGTFGNS